MLFNHDFLDAVTTADPSGNGGFPEEAWWLLRGSEAVPKERLHSERLLSVSPLDIVFCVPNFQEDYCASIHSETYSYGFIVPYLSW